MDLQVCLGTVGKRRVLLSATDAGVDESGNAGWMHLFVGRKLVHEDGTEFDLGGDVFAQMVRNFNASEQKRLSVDYDHRAWHPTNPDSKAAGWITELQVRKGELGFEELWARVEWTDSAATGIRGKEWQYCSPAFVLGNNPSTKTGNELGAQLLNVALTNIPFQDGLQPIRLSLAAAGSTPKELAMPDDKPADDKPADAEAKPEGDKPAEDDAESKLSALVDRFAEASGLDRLATLALLTEKAEEIGALLRSTADRDGAPTDEPEAMSKADADAVKAQLGTATEEVQLLGIEIKAKDAQLASLEAEVAALKGGADTKAADEAKAADDAIVAEVNQLVSDGYVQDVDRADALTLMRKDAPRARKAYSRKVVPIGLSHANPPPAVKPADDKPAVNPDAPDGDPFAGLTDDERDAARVLVAAKQQMHGGDVIQLRKYAAKRVREHSAALAARN
jgi:hypothetical protein